VPKVLGGITFVNHSWSYSK